MQSDLLHYNLHHAALQGARERCSLESGVPNAQPVGQMEYLLHHDHAGPFTCLLRPSTAS